LHRRIAEALEQRFPALVEARPELAAHHYGEAAIADKGSPIGISRANRQISRGARRSHNYASASVCWAGYRRLTRQQLELDIHITLLSALMASKGYADPETVTVLERANRLVTETGVVGTQLHFSVLYGLWVSNETAGAVAAALEHATNFLSVAQSQPFSGPLLVAHRALAHSMMYSGDYPPALAHAETAASSYRPDEHRDSAFRYGQDIGVSAFVVLAWALWHRGYPDQSARAADRALALSRRLGHDHTLAHASGRGPRPGYRHRLRL
jgi:hypothetical protein